MNLSYVVVLEEMCYIFSQDIVSVLSVKVKVKMYGGVDV
jgi:hypothetical protein